MMLFAYRPAQNVMERNGLMHQIRKKTLAVLCLFILCVAALCSCTTEQPTPDPDAIIGQWEYWDQVWCEFNEDGTCLIGGTTGTYSVSDDMVLTMTPTGGDPQSFAWAGSKENITTNNWFIADGALYMNGGVYQWIEPEAEETTQAVTQPATQSGTEQA